MNAILLPVAIVAGIGLLAGLGLAIASIVMAVPKDEKAEAVLEVLPGANCGACGYSGCSGYAAALAKGEAQPGLCSPGGEQVSQAVAAILGVEAGQTEHALSGYCILRCGRPAVWRHRAVLLGLYGIGGLCGCLRIRGYHGVQWACQH